MLDRTASQSCGVVDAPDAVSETEAQLRFERGGGRTILSRQYVPYPFHATRPFYLDRKRPDLATLYLQSASGGIYRGDRLSLTLAVGTAAAAHVTTQASTIVHRTDAAPAMQRCRIAVASDGIAAVTFDPLVLFPGAAISTATEITLAETAHAIVTDGFGWHDPDGDSRPFDCYRGALEVRDVYGTVLMAERGSLAGEYFSAPSSPLGRYRAVGTLLILGPRATACDAALIEHRIADCGAIAGISRLPNDCGVGGRVLAENGGVLARGLEAGFAAAFEALIGTAPERRRK